MIELGHNALAAVAEVIGIEGIATWGLIAVGIGAAVHLGFRHRGHH